MRQNIDNSSRRRVKQVVKWVGSSLKDLKKFPEAVKDEVGFILYLAQIGKYHKNVKSLTGFPRDIMEIKTITTKIHIELYMLPN